MKIEKVLCENKEHLTTFANKQPYGLALFCYARLRSK